MNKIMTKEEIIKAMVSDKRVRLNIIKKSHKFFFYYYFGRYAKYEIAPFHEEMFQITQDISIRNAVVVGFRGCSKSTIFSLSFPLWSVLGEQRLKHVVILSQTRQKAEMFLQQIKFELENNDYLYNDLGPFKEERNGWNAVSLYLPKYKAKITIASAEQSIRSLRHMEYRPQLVIADDCEDLESVKTLEGRNKIYDWFVGDIIPAGDKDTRIVVVGSLLHEDSLIKRLQKSIAEEKMDGIYREYPIADGNGDPTWPGRFPNLESIEKERRKGIPEITWQREYLLRIIPEEDQVIRPEWIKKYDVLPEANFAYNATGIDLAISEKETADFTAMVSAKICRENKKLKIYILPNPLNKRLSFSDTLERAKSLSIMLGDGFRSYLFIEEVGYQLSIIQQLKSAGFPAEGVKVHGQDKRARLTLVSYLVQNGCVVFPERGAEQLISQLLGFGAEKHDDLCDAFAILLIKIIEKEDLNHINFCFGDEFFDPEKDYTEDSGNSNDPKDNSNGGGNSGIQEKKIPFKKLWNNEEERKKIEHELDLEIMRRDLNPYYSKRNFA